MTTFIAISPVSGGGFYGRGESVEDAKVELKKAGGNLVRYVVLRLPEGAEKAYVDSFFGHVTWTWAEGADQTGTTEEVFRRGVPKADNSTTEPAKKTA